MKPLRTLGARGLYGLGLCFLVALFFGPMLTGDRFFAPGDGIAQNYPARMLEGLALRQGELPFWNPYNFSGAPLLASLQPGFFYPGNWAFWLAPGPWAMNLTGLLAYATAGLGAAAFGRAQGLSRFASVVMAVVFMFGGFLIHNIQNTTIIQVAALLPWLLTAIERFAATRRVRYALAGSAVIALEIFAGHPQMMAFGLIVAGAYALFRLGGVPSSDRSRYLLSLAAMGLLGLGLGAVQLLPTLEVIQASQRQRFTYEQLIYNSPPWIAAPSLLFPSWLGSRSITPLLDAPLWAPGPWRWWLYLYAGLGAYSLALIALLSRQGRGRSLFWGGVALLALLLFTGSGTPLYRVWASLPVLSQMPYPHRHGLEFQMALATLAGLGAQALVTAGAARRRAVLLATGLLTAGFVLVLAVVATLGPAFAARTQAFMPPGVSVLAAFKLSQPAFWLPLVVWACTCAAGWLVLRHPGRGARGAFVAVLAIDLWLAGYHNGDWQFCPTPPDTLPVALTGRVLSLPAHYYPYYYPMAKQEALALPGPAALRGISSVGGYDAFIERRYSRLLGLNSAGQLLKPAALQPAHHMVDVLNLSTVLIEAKRAQAPEWRQALAAPRWQLEAAEDQVVRYRNTRALPRAWRVARAEVLAPEQVDARMTNDVDFEPARVALLESAPSRLDWASGTAEAANASLNRIRVSTRGQGPGLVVVSESYDPGWKAFLGQQELPLHRADALVMAVEVPSGEHTVELRYEPTRWKQALAASAFALLLLLAWAWQARRRPHEAGRA